MFLGLMTKRIKVGSKRYKIKPVVEAFFLHNELFGEPASIDDEVGATRYIYCSLYCCNRKAFEGKISFEDFKKKINNKPMFLYDASIALGGGEKKMKAQVKK